MRKYKIVFILFPLTLFTNGIFGQDFIRVGVAHDFQKNKLVQTFSFDFNRTDKIDEKTGRYFWYSSNSFYILPTSDINIGDGVSSSENNILVQINMGKACFGDPLKSKDNLRTTVFNKAIEFNPAYNSDKLFNEKVSYGQLKFLLNLISSKNEKSTNVLKSVHSVAAGAFMNIGYRDSKTYETGDFYSTAGILLDYKTRVLRVLNSKPAEVWVFKLSGNYYYIVSDVKQLTTDNFAGIVKASIDRLIFTNTFAGLSYKYGNDNPNYKYIHTLEVSVKIKY